MVLSRFAPVAALYASNPSVAMRIRVVPSTKTLVVEFLNIHAPDVPVSTIPAVVESILVDSP